jgi:DNA-binding NarL/FixJ family response regulator
MIKIIIADDHTIVRRGLMQIVADASDMIVADEARNGHELLSKVSKEHFDVIVLDIAMPGPSGLDILKQLKHEYPNLPVLVLSIYPEEQYAVRTLKAGAAGYLTKEGAPDELIGAIRKAYTGGKYISASLAERLATDLKTEIEGPLHECLSDREFQVMCLIAAGKRVKEIAEELYLSPKTVSTYRSRILEKMNMKSNSELTHYAFKHCLVE